MDVRTRASVGSDDTMLEMPYALGRRPYMISLPVLRGSSSTALPSDSPLETALRRLFYCMSYWRRRSPCTAPTLHLSRPPPLFVERCL